MKAQEIIFAADMNQDIMDALVEVYQMATYEGGQHDLTNCRICGAEQNYHTGVMAHRPKNGKPCPVGKAADLIHAFYKEV